VWNRRHSEPAGRRLQGTLGSAAILAVGLALLSLIQPSAAPAAMVIPSGFTVEPVVTGLVEPVAISFAKDGRMFIAEKRGVIRVFKNGTLLPRPFVDISADVNNHFEHGMLGMTLHPEFPTVPYVYVLYIYDPPGVSKDVPGARVARVERIEADPFQTDVALTTAAARTVLVGRNGDASTITDSTRTPSLTCWRNGSRVEDCIPTDSYRHAPANVRFGTDGALYVGAGDADRLPAGPQDPGTWVGMILRVDPANGNGLPDNPFYNGNPASNLSKTWVYGLRNPFRFSFDPASGEMLIGDVGQDAWESMHRGAGGTNYGWPCYEGGSHVYPVFQNTALCQAEYARGPRTPIYTYGHTQNGGSITAGAWYHGTTYPTTYRGAHFFADYSQGWIKYLASNGTGGYVAHDFASDSPTAGVTSGIVDLVAGADTNLHWVSITTGTVYRLRYTPGNVAPTAVATADVRTGAAPLTVHLRGSGSFDPDGQTLSYLWTFGDGGTSTAADPTHTYATTGLYTATLTVTDAAGATATDTVAITVGSPPQLAITAPTDETVVNVGTEVAFSATAMDSNDGNITSRIAWTAVLHHNVHTHPNLLPATTGGSGSFVLIDHDDDTYVELCAQVTNSAGLSTRQCVDIRPRSAAVTMSSVPHGLSISFGGITRVTPFTVQANVGATRTLSTPLASDCYAFQHWSDGGAATHDIVVAIPSPTYTAFFTLASSGCAPPPPPAPLPLPPPAPQRSPAAPRARQAVSGFHVRIVRARAGRWLIARARVTLSASARLQLLRRNRALAHASKRFHPGPNTLRLRLPRALPRGAYVARLTIGGAGRPYTARIVIGGRAGRA
jgi:glucose/arabinose dehydrogenase